MDKIFIIETNRLKEQGNLATYSLSTAHWVTHCFCCGLFSDIGFCPYHSLMNWISLFISDNALSERHLVPGVTPIYSAIHLQVRWKSCVMACHPILCGFLSSAQCSLDKVWFHYNPDQDKAITEDEWISQNDSVTHWVVTAQLHGAAYDGDWDELPVNSTVTEELPGLLSSPVLRFSLLLQHLIQLLFLYLTASQPPQCCQIHTAWGETHHLHTTIKPFYE